MQTLSERLNKLWLSEAIKRKELSGSIDDALTISQMAGEANLRGATDESLICRRAALLATHSPVAQALHRNISHFHVSSKYALFIVAMTAILSGISLSISAVSQGFKLNVFILLFVILVPHLIGLLWSLIIYSQLNPSNSILADAWIWLTKRIGRRHDAVLMAESLRSLLGHTGKLPKMLLGISHLWWTLFALSTMVMMYLFFSFSQYAFVWETTIQNPLFFVAAVKAVGWLPGLLGFPVPESADIASLTDSPETRKAWALFILGCLTIYGLAPRLLMLAWSWAVALKSLRCISLNTADAYYINLLERIRNALKPPPAIIDPDMGGTSATGSQVTAEPRKTSYPIAKGLVPYELRDLSTLPESGPEGRWVTFENVVDDLTHQAALTGIREQNIAEIVLMYDARNSADRGAFQFLLHLKSLCEQVQVVLLNQDIASANKCINWLEGLREAGIDTVLEDFSGSNSPSLLLP